MRRTLRYALGLMLLAAGACGQTQVVVSVEIDVPDPDGGGSTPLALSELEVQLLPWDRDQIFDSLTMAYGTPEPEIPQELLDARAEVQAAQAQWDASQRRWNILRDTLQKISTVLEEYSRGEPQYLILFRDFQDFDSEYGGVERQMEADFEVFDNLQRGTIRASDSVRILQDNWADDAFADIADVLRARQQATGLEAVYDTTDASGVARTNFMGVRPGDYWVHARYELTYTELYWNIPITVTTDAPVEVRLTRENAEERLRL